MTHGQSLFRSCRNSTGFSLVELIVVIVITGVIAGTVGVFIVRPIQGYDAQLRRAELVEAAESALRRMQRDIRRALPNSIRIREAVSGTTGNVTCPAAGNTCVLELLFAVDGARYRANPPGGPAARMQFGVVETDFDVIGVLQNFAQISAANDWLVINNQVVTGSQYNAYFGDNRGRLSSVATAVSHINLVGTNFAATLASPRQRFFIVNTPVTYLCDTSANAQTLTRYSGYAITTNHASVDTDAELMGAGAPTTVRARSADLVSSCQFSYQPGSSSRSGLVTIALTISDPQTNEEARLLHQVHVDNVP